MTADELVIDAFYAVQYSPATLYVFKNVGGGGTNQPYMTANAYSKGSLHAKYNTGFQGKEYRHCTAEEIRHLKACIEANNYVPLPKPEIINTYEIY